MDSPSMTKANIWPIGSNSTIRVRIYKIRKTDEPASQSSGNIELKIAGNLDNNDRKEPPKEVPVPE